MKALKVERNQRQGSVLMVTLFMTALIGFFLFAYLYLVRAQNSFIARSQAWNSALPMAEAGVEEALAQMNPGAASVNVDLTQNGWGLPSGGNYGPISRTLSNGTYSVLITAGSPPVIYSTGYVSLATISATLSRTVRVSTTNVALFSVSFGSRFGITMHGSGISSDSFDSSDPNKSDNGQYPAAYPSRIGTNGDVASVFGPVDFGNHDIHGDLYLGPTAQFNSSSNQVAGTVYNDFNFDYPDVVLPTTTWLPATSTNATINGITYQYVFTPPGGDYTIADSGSVYVSSNTAVRLKVTASNYSPGGLRIAGTGNSSGKLTVYMLGASSTMGGNTTVDSGVAGNFAYFGLPSNTSITYSGTSSFVGCIYAPDADLTLNGGGSNNGLIGSSITKTITMNGHYNFHFDESLLHNSFNRGYSAASWREL